jgi:hypothetical protein
VKTLRGEKCCLDADLAEFYGVKTKALNQAVKRNRTRVPADFMFRLTARDSKELNRSQSVTGSQKHRDPRYPPYAFTEQGVAMLSSVLHSPRAVHVNVEIMRMFVRLRKTLAVSAELASRLDEVEKRLGGHDRAILARHPGYPAAHGNSRFARAPANRLSASRRARF